MKGAAFITTSWDDGHPLDLRLASLLAKYRIPATFYIPRSSQRPTLTAEQIRQLSEKFEIGGHTLEHVDLVLLNETRAKHEITASKSWIEHITGRPCLMFCPPLGHYHGWHLPLIHHAGYVGVRTVELFSLSPPRQQAGVWVMPTTVQAYPHGGGAYLKNGLRRLALGNMWHYIIHGRGRSFDELAKSLVRRVLHKGGVFHLWGHSWELEEAGQWQRLEEVLRLLAAVAGRVQMMTNAQICHSAQRGAAGGTAGKAAEVVEA